MDHNFLSLVIATVKVLRFRLHGALMHKLIQFLLRWTIKEARLKKEKQGTLYHAICIRFFSYSTLYMP